MCERRQVRRRRELIFVIEDDRRMTTTQLTIDHQQTLQAHHTDHTHRDVIRPHTQTTHIATHHQPPTDVPAHHTDHTHPFNGPLSRTTRVSRYQKGKTNQDFTEARDSEWQWHQLDHMQVCTSLQTDNHTSTPPLSFYRPDALPAAQPTASKHWRQRTPHKPQQPTTTTI